jgi:hypothetical protein
MLGAFVLVTPNVLVGNGGGKFDGGLRLTDEATREHLAALLVAFRDWIHRLG